ncbi:uncharacterized protein LOC116518739 [Thamnophis elegans]|uniref:uncharacterized protein LOC116518739 n=1 Tax=Thamnophis elegans TaxID=35005 RepID=UPI001376DC40|nr:uncharacterized protein LOC116518739 [Thamnophis elegans]
MGRDLLCKLRAQIFFDEKGSVGVKYGNVNLEIPKEEAWRIMVVQEVSGDKWREFRVPGLWVEDNPPGFAALHTPIIVEELPMSLPVCIRQRGYPREIVQAIQEVIQMYLTYKILVPTDSPWNSPILPIPKGEGKYRMAQDLRRVNSSTVTIYPTLPNPYVLLGLIPPEAKWFSVIDLKDAFFSIPIHKKSQHLFAFEWENPTTGRKQQYTWTRLPQGYKNSPTHFSAALATDLEILDLPPPDVVLQYVDDLLVTGQTEEDCHANTAALLLLLQEKGYKASRAKAQLVQLNVRYLGYDIQQGQRTLGHERKEAICQLPAPRNRKELRGFLGAAGFCRIWIPNFALLAKPLYEATKGNEKEPLRWEKEEQKSFLNLKHALTQAPSLGLPNLDKPFHLFVDTKQNMAVGVLTQKMGTWYRPVAYLSKQLDQVAKGWPSCLKAVAGTALLTQEANKLTFGQQLNIYTPHALRAVLDQKGHLWLTNPRMLKYQGLITHNPLIKLVQSYALNPATLLPEPDSEISHDCLQTIEETYASRPDLKDEPFSDPDATLFTDGTSFIHEGVRKAAYAIVTLDDVWEAKPLPAGTSAQLAELHALTRALELAKGLRVNIYTDSKYAFLTVQVHGALYKERGLITAGGKDIKYGPQILRLLDSVWAPKQVAIMHVRGHQKGISTAERGNHKADQVARAAALDPFSLQANCLTLWIPNQEDEPPSYSHSEVQQAEAIGAELVNGWWTLPDNRVFVPQQTLSSLYTLPKGEDEGRTPPRLLIHGTQSLYGQVVKTPLQVSLQIARGAPPVQIWEVPPDYEDPFPEGGNVISGSTSQPPYVRDGKKGTQQTPDVRALTVTNDSPVKRPYPEPYLERTGTRGKRTPLDFSLDMKYDITNDQLPIMVRIYCQIMGNVRNVWLLQWWSDEENLSSMKPQVLSETRHLGIIRNYDEKSSCLKVWITHSNYSESYQCRAVTLEMAEEVAKALTVKNCFVCGGTNMGEKWPWEALEATPEVYNNMTLKGNLTQRTQHTDN